LTSSIFSFTGGPAGLASRSVLEDACTSTRLQCFHELIVVGGEMMIISKSALLGAFATPEYGINF